jgi:hypothetical protein
MSNDNVTIQSTEFQTQQKMQQLRSNIFKNLYWEYQNYGKHVTLI